LFTHQLALEIHKERQREVESRLFLRALGRDRLRLRRISLRHRLGRGLIRIGSMLAPDASLQLAARR
jgi:hypothetical protein